MKSGQMLEKLYEAMDILPSLLSDRSAWNSLIVNRRKPFTYRVFATMPNGMRVCLHKFDPCHTHEAFAHPHPWPGAFIVLKGSYRMMVGYSRDRMDQDYAEVMTTILNKHSCYEIINPLTWHAVIPLETTYTIMGNAAPWDTELVAHKNVRATRGKDLDKMPEPELLEHLSIFQGLVQDWKQSHETVAS